jgi:hypothetical protein
MVLAWLLPDAPAISRIAGFNSQKSQWINGLNNIFYMFSTLIYVFTLDRIGRRWTLSWGAVGQGIAMFLAGGIARGGLNAKALVMTPPPPHTVLQP